MKIHLLNNKKKKIIFATIILLSVAILTFGLLATLGFGVKQRWTLFDKSLDYEFININYYKNSKTPIFSYYTTETSKDRLIKLNDTVISELKRNKKIKNSNNEYYIDYFNDKDSAINFYKPSESSALDIFHIKRIRLITSRVAQMYYSNKKHISKLVNMLDGKILKNY